MPAQARQPPDTRGVSDDPTLQGLTQSAGARAALAKAQVPSGGRHYALMSPQGRPGRCQRHGLVTASVTARSPPTSRPGGHQRHGLVTANVTARSPPASRPGHRQRHGPVTAHASVTAASLLSAHGHQRPSHHTRELSPGFADTEAQSFLQSQSEVGHQEVRSPFSNESRFRVLGTSTVASPLFAADGPLQLREATMLSTVPGGSRF